MAAAQVQGGAWTMDGTVPWARLCMVLTVGKVQVHAWAMADGASRAESCTDRL